MNKPCEYCGCDLPLGVDKKTRQQRSNHFATCKARPVCGVEPAQQKPWGFHIQFNNGRDATFKGLDHLAECEALQEAGETITLLYTKEN